MEALCRRLPLIGLLYFYNAALGFGIGLDVVARMMADGMLAPSAWGLGGWIALCAAFGCVAGFYRYHSWLGHPGWRGLCRAVIGSVLMTGFAALVAGSACVPVTGTVYAPWIVAHVIVGDGLSGTLVLADILASHALVMLWRNATRAHPFETRSSLLAAQGPRVAP